MSKQKRQRVNVKLKDVIIKDNSPHVAEWIYKGKHQKWLSRTELQKLANGETLRLMTINPPKHTRKSLQKRSEKKAKKYLI
jgi:hypothetical protein